MQAYTPRPYRRHRWVLCSPPRMQWENRIGDSGLVALPPSFAFIDLPAPLPAGYAAAPVSPEQAGSLVRLCVLLKTDARSASLVLLRDTLDAKVYLGCVIDAANRVQTWTEVWIQDSAGLNASPASYRDLLGNAALDAKWQKACASATGIIATGFESRSPGPLFIDGKTHQTSCARDKRTNAAWALCTDEALLASKGVPAYSSSRSRHLYQPELGASSELIPLEVFGGDATALAAALGLAGDPIPFNASCGLMMVRSLAPMSLEQYADAVKGVPSDLGPADSVLRSIAVASSPSSGADNSSGFLRLGGVGVAGRIIESLHLQLMALANVVQSTRTCVAATQAPLLNITADSYRVSVSKVTAALPIWWTAHVELTLWSDAAELHIPGTSSQYFVSGQAGGSSIYSPSSMARALSGRGWLRPRSVTPDASGMIVEATLSAQERISAGNNDLIWIRAGIGTSRFDLYMFAEQQNALAGGELRLRSLPQKLPDDAVAKLRAGTPISDVSFELIPMLSSPCDLYAMGILAVRLLLTNQKHPLPAALDDLMSLAAAACAIRDTGLELPERIEHVFKSDARFAAMLGPQLLLADIGNDSALAFEAIPPRLWYGVLAMIIRMLTGLSPDSRCKDLGDAPVGAIHRVFDGTCEDLAGLITSCRALIVPEHTLNREVRSVLDDCLSSMR